jgi:hypothetical protein
MSTPVCGGEKVDSCTQCLRWKRKGSRMVLEKKRKEKKRKKKEKSHHLTLSKFIILHSFIFCTDTLIT